MKYLCNEIPWENIKAVGFDMDGTLYDEFDFIVQVYNPIAKLFSYSDDTINSIKHSMLLKWLDKGSSYPFIFSEILFESGFESDLHEKKIKEALLIFRNFIPALFLSERIKFSLEEFKGKYELFLVSDGSSPLQWNKIKSLGLEKYFDKHNIFVSGDHGKGADKPSLMSLDHLAVFNRNFKKNEVVFIGDRSNDEGYAKNAGFHFIDVNKKKNLF